MPTTPARHPKPWLGWFGATWGVGGVLFLLGYAIWRLAPLAAEALRGPLGGLQWAVLVAFVLFMAYSEGYRGFQRAFSPRVAARARNLRDAPTLPRVVLAPLFCMAYFAAPRRRRIAAYAVTLGVVLLVILVQRLEQPWRGIVDAGVVLGLGWGFVATLVYAVRAMRGDAMPVPAEVV